MSRLNVLKGVMISLVITGFSGCTSTSDIEVQALTSEKVNLAGYKTYEIIEGSGIVDNTQRSDNLDTDAEMKQMINALLSAMYWCQKILSFSKTMWMTICSMRHG